MRLGGSESTLCLTSTWINNARKSEGSQWKHVLWQMYPSPPCTLDTELASPPCEVVLAYLVAICVFLESHFWRGNIGWQGLKSIGCSKLQLFPTVISRSNLGDFQWHLVLTLDLTLGRHGQTAHVSTRWLVSRMFKAPLKNSDWVILNNLQIFSSVTFSSSAGNILNKYVCAFISSPSATVCHSPWFTWQN